MNLKSLKKAFSLIKEDKVLIIPYLIFFLVFQITILNLPFKIDENSRLSLNLISIFVFIWLIEVSLKTFIISSVCHKTLKSHKNESPLSTTFYYLKYIVLAIISIILPSLLLMQSIRLLPNAIVPILYLISFFLVIFSMIIIQLIPVVIVAEKLTIKPAFQHLFNIIKFQPKDIMIFISTTIMILLMTLLLSNAFSQITLPGAEVFEVAIKSIGYTLQYCYATVFYLVLSKKLVLVEEEEEL